MKNKILVTVNWLVVVVMLVSACMLDSGDWPIFLAVTFVCAGYLALYTLANADRGGVL